MILSVEPHQLKAIQEHEAVFGFKELIAHPRTYIKKQPDQDGFVLELGWMPSHTDDLWYGSGALLAHLATSAASAEIPGTELSTRITTFRVPYREFGVERSFYHTVAQPCIGEDELFNHFEFSRFFAGLTERFTEPTTVIQRGGSTHPTSIPISSRRLVYEEFEYGNRNSINLISLLLKDNMQTTRQAILLIQLIQQNSFGQLVGITNARTILDTNVHKAKVEPLSTIALSYIPATRAVSRCTRIPPESIRSKFEEVRSMVITAMIRGQYY